MASSVPASGPNAALPALRSDLVLLEGPADAQGNPSWLLHDRARHHYVQIDWVSHELLRHWPGAPARAEAAQAVAEGRHAHPGATAETLLAAVRAEGRVQAGAADVRALLEFLQAQQLLEVAPGRAPELAAARARMAGTWMAWLLHNYLFFRIPLLRPDAFLGRTVGATAWLFTRGFAWLTVAAGLAGLVGVSRQWEVFTGTLVDFFSWQGLLAYGLTLGVVKVLHEFGHAYTAKRQGCRVPTMGLAFLVLWPVLYTDTNDAWRLKAHRERLAVSGAGILTELVLAAWATGLWVVVPDGLARSMLFLLATTTWVSTVAINLSPFMRFDGYFILMDWLGFPNLHARAFAMARWHLRRRLLGLPDAPPESMAPGQRLAVIAFAWATWAYRLVLFLGIAVLVYQFFIKLVGIVLFVVEIIWFIAWPLASELAVWRRRWGDVDPGRRYGLVAAGGMLVLGLGWLPLPTRVVASGLLVPEAVQAYYAPRGAMLREGAGAETAKGQPLWQLDAPQLQAQGEANAAQQRSASAQSRGASLSPEAVGQWESLAAQSGVARAEGQLIQSDLGQYRLRAPFAGRTYTLDPDLRPGQWLAQGEKLGQLVGEGGVRVLAYVADVDARRLAVGQRAQFVADSGVGPVLRLQVEQIQADRARTLAEPELAQAVGGSVPVREQRGALFPEGTFYRVLLRPVPGQEAAEQAAAGFRWRGQVYIAAHPEPVLAPWGRSAVSVLVRELGF